MGRGPEPPSCAAWIACHTRIGVSGMSIVVTPSGRSASSTEATTAGEQAMVAASPTPLTPSVLVGVRVDDHGAGSAGSGPTAPGEGGGL